MSEPVYIYKVSRLNCEAMIERRVLVKRTQHNITSLQGIHKRVQKDPVNSAYHVFFDSKKDAIAFNIESCKRTIHVAESNITRANQRMEELRLLLKKETE